MPKVNKDRGSRRHAYIPLLYLLKRHYQGEEGGALKVRITPSQPLLPAEELPTKERMPLETPVIRARKQTRVRVGLP